MAAPPDLNIHPSELHKFRVTDNVIDALYLQTSPTGHELRAFWRCPAKAAMVHSTQIHEAADVVGTRAWGCPHCLDNTTWLRLAPNLQLRKSSIIAPKPPVAA